MTVIGRHSRQCRCAPCTAYRVRKMAPTEHGTISGAQRGCRCDSCLAAKQRYDAIRNAKRKAPTVALEPARADEDS